MLEIFNKILHIFIDTIKFMEIYCFNTIKQVNTIIQMIFCFLYNKIYLTILNEPNLQIVCLFHHLTTLYLLYVMVLLSVTVNLVVMGCSEAYSGYIS